MAGYESAGFVLYDGVKFEHDQDRVLAEGEIRCDGGIRIKVRKVLSIVTPGSDPIVSTQRYSYNVFLAGRFNIFRYDSPEPGATDARAHHHVHRYEAFSGDTDGSVKPIYDGQAVPTLGQVIAEAREWYHDNYVLVHNLDALVDDDA